MLVQHTQFKEATIYAPLRRKAPPTRLSTIGQMSDPCAPLYSDYRAIQLEHVHIYPRLTTPPAA